MYHVLANKSIQSISHDANRLQFDHTHSFLGNISREILRDCLPPPSPDCLIVNMGPKKMNELFADIILADNKYDPETMVN